MIPLVSILVPAYTPRLLLIIENVYKRRTSFRHGRCVRSRLIRPSGLRAAAVAAEFGIVLEYSPGSLAK
jgi:hypothetical protein